MTEWAVVIGTCSNPTSLGPRPKPPPARIASSITHDTGSDSAGVGFGSGAETTITHENGAVIKLSTVYQQVSTSYQDRC